MYLVFSPHNPLLISKISREHADKFTKSMEAWKYIRTKIYSINPRKIIIIMPTYSCFDDVSINQSSDFIVNFREFGDLSMEFKVPGDLDLSTRLKYFLRKNNFKVNFFSDQYINYRSFLPLYYLNKYHISSIGFDHQMEHEETIPNEFVVLNCCNRDLNYHEQFGKLFSDFLEAEADEEIAIIFCGDFIKDLREEKKEEFKEKKEEIIKIISENNYAQLKKWGENMLGFNCPFLKPLISVLPVIENYNLQSNIISSESVFDENYLVAEFE